ncbi:MAG: thioredoxin domain-containing protein [Panacibacter sp.]
MNRILKGKNFTKEIIEAKKVAIVQFKTKWNGGCQIIAPIYEELSRSYATKAKFFTIDTQQEQLLAKEYGIVELPTILFFKSGELIDHVVGLAPKNILITKIENAIAGLSN